MSDEGFSFISAGQDERRERVSASGLNVMATDLGLLQGSEALIGNMAAGPCHLSCDNHTLVWKLRSQTCRSPD